MLCVLLQNLQCVVCVAPERAVCCVCCSRTCSVLCVLLQNVQCVVCVASERAVCCVCCFRTCSVLCVLLQNVQCVVCVAPELQIRQHKGLIAEGVSFLVVEDPQPNIGSGSATLNALLCVAEYLAAKEGMTVSCQGEGGGLRRRGKLMAGMSSMHVLYGRRW